MTSTKELIEFAQTFRAGMLDPDDHLGQIITQLKISQRELCNTNESTLVEISNDMFKAWTEFQQNYQAPSLKPVATC